MVTHFTTNVFLFYHPEDGRTTGRNMLPNILWIKINHRIKVHVVRLFTYFKNLIEFNFFLKINTVDTLKSFCILS